MTRFAIKVARHWTTTPIILKDRWQPAFLRSFATLDEACLAMDNIIRRDHAMPPRVPITRREIRRAMATYARIDRERLDEEMTAPRIWDETKAVDDLTQGRPARISSQAGLASFRGGAL